MSESKNKGLLLTLVKIAVSLVLVGVLIFWADPSKILPALAVFQWAWAPVILLVIAASVGVSAWKWGVLIRGGSGCVGWWDLFGTYTAGLFFNNFLPSSIGGDGARIFMAGKFGYTKAESAASVIVERTLATASLGLLGAGTGLFALHPNLLGLFLLTGVFLVGLLLTLVLISGYLPKKIREGKGKFASGFRSFSASAGTLRQKPKALITSFLLAIVFQILVATVVGCVLLALGQSWPPLTDLVFIVSAASVLAMVPLGLNGYGLREGAFIVLLAPYGVPAATALAVSVIFALSVSVYSLPGAAYWILRKPKSLSCPLPEGVQI